MTSLYHGALLFRVHLAGEELRLTSDYQLSRFFPLPAFPSPLWRALAERVARSTRTWFALAQRDPPEHVRDPLVRDSSVPIWHVLCYWSPTQQRRAPNFFSAWLAALLHPCAARTALR